MKNWKDMCPVKGEKLFPALEMPATLWSFALISSRMLIICKLLSVRGFIMQVIILMVMKIVNNYYNNDNSNNNKISK